VYLFQILYMFRSTMCPSSGEILYLCDIGIFHSVWVAVSKRLRWAGPVERMGEERGCIGSWWGNQKERDH